MGVLGYYTEHFNFSKSSFVATLWLVEADLRKWDKRGKSGMVGQGW